MAGSNKRKADANSSGQAKKAKYSKFKNTSRGNDNSLATLTNIEYGSSGIWATCVRGLESKSTGQMRDVLDEYAAIMYPDMFASEDPKDKQPSDEKDESKTKEDADDIESAIKAELDELKGGSLSKRTFKTVRIDVACVEPPIDPVALVERICRDAGAGTATKRTRHINRLTPVTLTGRAADLEEVANKVLAPHFHQEGVESKTFAVRTAIRNHDVLSRQQIIDKVASLVGQKHKVNLTKPDLVILVDIYKNICGMSVVSGDYERLKRFNLNELYNNGSTSAAAEAKSEEKNDSREKGEEKA